MSYEIEGICNLFKNTGLHHQTVRAWLKRGLKKIDNQKPILIMGSDLIAFLKDQNERNRCQVSLDQIYCMRCKQPSHVFRNTIEVTQEKNFIRVKALCRTCKSIMNKSVKLDDFSIIKKTFKMGDISELRDCIDPTDKNHIVNHPKPCSEESLKQAQIKLL